MDSCPRFSSRRGGALLRLIVFLVIFCGVITAAWVFFLPVILSSTLTKRTGFDVKVERLRMNPFVAEVDLEGLVISNPHTFPRPDYVDVRSFEARAPFKTLFSERPVFDYVRVVVAHVTFVRNTDGTLNAELFYDRLFPMEKTQEAAAGNDASSAKAKAPEKKATPPGPKKVPFLIHRLELKVDRVTWDDEFSRVPSTRDFNVGIDQTFTDVTDAKQLLTPATLRTISPAATAISGLIPGELGHVIGAAAGGPAMPEAPKKVDEPVSATPDTLEESRRP